MKRIALFGGSFNPPHLGHREALEAALAHFDEVVVVPCGPRGEEKGKENLKDIHPLHRAFMASLAFRDLSRVTVDDADLDQAAFTRTWDLDQRYAAQGAEVWHIVGTDWFTPPDAAAAPPILDWHRGEDLWNTFRFAVVTREGYATLPRHLPPTRLMLPPCRQLSSSDVRARVFHREPFEDLVTPEVAEYIRRYDLYLPKAPVTKAVFSKPIVPMVVTDSDNPECLEMAKHLKRMTPFGTPNVIVVLGGDGMMMHAVRDHWHLRLPFLGLNFGHLGHFMNRVEAEPLATLWRDDLVVRQTPLLNVEWTDAAGERHAELGVNDAWLRNVAQSGWYRLTVDGEVRIEHISGDGLLVASPQGSTGYAFNAGATPLFDQPGLVIAGLLLDRFRNWSPVQEKAEAVVTIEAFDTDKRAVHAFIDSVPKGPATSMQVRSSRVAGAEFIFTSEDDLERKRLRFQYPR